MYRAEPQSYNQYKDDHRLKPVNPSQCRPANPVSQSRQSEVENPFYSSDKVAYSLRSRLGNISSSAAILGDWAQFWLLLKGLKTPWATFEQTKQVHTGFKIAEKTRWMDRWMEGVKAFLRIAYSNKKNGKTLFKTG